MKQQLRIDFGVATRFTDEPFLQEMEPVDYVRAALEHGIDALFFRDYHNDEAVDHAAAGLDTERYLVTRDDVGSHVLDRETERGLFCLRGIQFNAQQGERAILYFLGYPQSVQYKIKNLQQRTPLSIEELLDAQSHLGAITLLGTPGNWMAGSGGMQSLAPHLPKVDALEANQMMWPRHVKRVTAVAEKHRKTILYASAAKRITYRGKAHFGTTYTTVDGGFFTPDSIRPQYFMQQLHQALQCDGGKREQVQGVYESRALGVRHLMTVGRPDKGRVARILVDRVVQGARKLLHSSYDKFR